MAQRLRQGCRAGLATPLRLALLRPLSMAANIFFGLSHLHHELRTLEIVRTHTSVGELTRRSVTDMPALMEMGLFTKWPPSLMDLVRFLSVMRCALWDGSKL